MRRAAPQGYSSVSPYLLVEDVEQELAFAEAVFGAQIKGRQRNPDGHVWRGEARIGETVIMVDRASDERPPAPAMLYVWVNDVDACFAAALEHGAVPASAPTNQFHGNREAGVRDSQGNTWWIARAIEKLSNREVERRLARQRQERL